jgi:ABC-type transport system substrate-binding protein
MIAEAMRAAPSQPQRCHGEWPEPGALLTVLLIWLLALSVTAVAAPPSRVLRVELREAEASLDPALGTDAYSLALIEALYEPALIPDYLARPVRLQPGLLTRLPESSDGGLHWRLELRAGLRFAPDPLFGAGRTRQLGAEDLRYSLQRLADPGLHSPFAWLIRDHVAAMQVRDALHLEITLRQPEPDFPRWLAVPATSVVPREVVEGAGLDAHPVGSGPYRLVERIRGAHYTLTANPNYRSRRWDFRSDDPALAALVADMQGRPVPAIPRIEIAVIDEPQSAWLTFRQGELDLLWLQDLLAPKALGELPAGVRNDRITNPVLNYFVFNLRDRDFGGMQPEKIALRRAILLALDADAFVREVREGQARALAWPVPPGLPDEQPGYRSALGFDPATAAALLEEFGFRRGDDGFRRWPDGRPLRLRVASRANAMGRAEDEFIRRALARIGVRMVAEHPPVSEFIKSARACQLQFARADWFADAADGEEFFDLLDPARIGSMNYSCFMDSEWQAELASARALHESVQRSAAFLRLARRVEWLGVWKPSDSSYRNVLVQARVHGFHSHPFLWSNWQYLDVD